MDKKEACGIVFLFCGCEARVIATPIGTLVGLLEEIVVFTPGRSEAEARF